MVTSIIQLKTSLLTTLASFPTKLKWVLRKLNPFYRNPIVVATSEDHIDSRYRVVLRNPSLILSQISFILTHNEYIREAIEGFNGEYLLRCAAIDGELHINVYRIEVCTGWECYPKDLGYDKVYNRSWYFEGDYRLSLVADHRNQRATVGKLTSDVLGAVYNTLDPVASWTLPLSSDTQLMWGLRAIS